MRGVACVVALVVVCLPVGASNPGEPLDSTDWVFVESGILCNLVRTCGDIRDCLAIGCGGVIVGRAYYEGTIDLAQAIAEAQDASA